MIVLTLAVFFTVAMGWMEASLVEASGTRTLDSLEIGDRVVDKSWEWEHRTGSDYSGTGVTWPVTWIVVAKDHYGDDSGVTLMTEELIGLYAFDNSTDRDYEDAQWGYNHWGESGTGDATRGLRPWLNSSGIHSGEGFYQEFSADFQAAVIQVTIPNRCWEAGADYSTQDRVFVPSTTELGDTLHYATDPIGTVYGYFSGASKDDRVAQLGGTARWYWTRSPGSDYGDCVFYVASAGDFYGGYYAYAGNGGRGVRPALNLKSETLVSDIKNADGAYELFVSTPDPDPVAGYTVYLTVSPPGGGTVHGAGTYEEGTNVTVTATPYAGYTFVNWKENGSLLSTAASYSFNVTDNCYLTANFKAKGDLAENYLGSLQFGDRVVDPSWVWEHRTGDDYSGTGETKPVTWIVVAKDHYGAGSGVTLLAEELIGLHAFDNSTDRSASNHWGESGTTNATRGLRPWLNSSGIHSGEGFYHAFSADFQAAVNQVTIPNKEWPAGEAYTTKDRVFVPSTTELRAGTSLTYPIGTVYPFFSGAGNNDRVAQLGGNDNRYWTRSPDAYIYGGYVRVIDPDGSSWG